jgi:hypothetical protein
MGLLSLFYVRTILAEIPLRYLQQHNMAGLFDREFKKHSRRKKLGGKIKKA